MGHPGVRADRRVLAFLLSIYFTALVIRLFMELRVTEAVPAALVDKLEAAIRDKKFQDAYDVCKDNDSFLARLVRTGIANLPNGRAVSAGQGGHAAGDGRDGDDPRNEDQLPGRSSVPLGPMIGLVGTIWGYDLELPGDRDIAASAQPRPEKVAEGISTALFITLEGVSLAVPAIFFFAFFRNRIAQMTMESTRVADRTINSLVAAAKSGKPRLTGLCRFLSGRRRHVRLDGYRTQGRAQSDSSSRRRLSVDHVLHAGDQLQ